MSDTTAACPAQQQVSISNRGSALVTWLAQRGPSSSIQVIGSDPVDGWDTRQKITRGPDLGPPRVAENGAGDTGIVWSADAGSGQIINGAFRTAGARWQRTRIPRATGDTADIGIDQHGDAVIADNGPGDYVTAISRSHDGAFSAPTPILPVTGQPLIEVDPQGAAIAIASTKGQLFANANPLATHPDPAANAAARYLPPIAAGTTRPIAYRPSRQHSRIFLLLSQRLALPLRSIWRSG